MMVTIKAETDEKMELMKKENLSIPGLVGKHYKYNNIPMYLRAVHHENIEKFEALN